MSELSVLLDAMLPYQWTATIAEMDNYCAEEACSRFPGYFSYLKDNKEFAVKIKLAHPML